MRLQITALEFDSAGKEEADGGEQFVGFLGGKILQVGGVKGVSGVIDDSFHAVQAACAGFRRAGSLESGQLFAVGPVVGHGAFFPLPIGGLLSGGSGGPTLAACPNAIGSCEGAGRA